jgi:hypothetical protein
MTRLQLVFGRGLRYARVTAEFEGQDTLMARYLYDVLHDASVTPSVSSRDFQDVLALLKESNGKIHLTATEDKTSRWFSHFTHASALDKKWHLTLGT